MNKIVLLHVKVQLLRTKSGEMRANTVRRIKIRRFLPIFSRCNVHLMRHTIERPDVSPTATFKGRNAN